MTECELYADKGPRRESEMAVASRVIYRTTLCLPKLTRSLSLSCARVLALSLSLFLFGVQALGDWIVEMTAARGSLTNKGARLANSRNWYPLHGDDLLNGVNWWGGSAARNTSWWCVEQLQRLDGGGNYAKAPCDTAWKLADRCGRNFRRVEGTGCLQLNASLTP